MSLRLLRPAAALGTLVLTAGLVGAVAPAQGRDAPSPPTPEGMDADCAVPGDAVVDGRGSASGGDPYFPADGNGGYDVRSYTIKTTYRPRSDRLVGTTVLDLVPREDLDRFNLDLVLDVGRVVVDGTVAQATQPTKHEVVVTPDRPLVAGQPTQVKVSYAGRPSTRTAEGMSPNSDLYFHAPGETVAMGEPQNGAWWFAANETPTDKASFDITMRVPAGDAAVSNGTLRSKETADGWTTRRWTISRPITTYMAFFAAGDFDVRSGRVDGRRYTYAVSQKLTRSARADAFTFLGRTPAVVSWLEQKFGPYPFRSIGGVVTGLDSPYALETATRPIYPFVGAGGTTLVAHENAHQWFGDDVSVCRWTDVWLNEGFASYVEWLWNEEHGGPTVDTVLRKRYAALAAGNGFWNVQVSDPGPDDMWDTPVYERGAMMLAALRNRIGDDAFSTVLRTWVSEQGGGHGTGSEFRALAARVSGEDLTSFFQVWLDDTAKPAATVENGLG